MMIINYADSS